MFQDQYDVIVVGAGHAGSEAAAAAANMGCSTLLVTMNLQNIAQMSCNPAMGGIAKGQIVREIDALGGYSGLVSDTSAIQFKMLNKSKGPAMWSPRVQSDRMLFAEHWRLRLEATANLDFYQEMVAGLLVAGDKIIGVRTSMGIEIKGKAVILTNGTFLNGLIHIGDKQFGGGRAGERASTGITEDLVKLGFEAGRMKTGTPPRVDGRSLDYSKMIEQPGDEIPAKFSYLDETKPLQKQRSCYMSYTSPEVHELLKEGFDRSPMFNGRIKSIGPRYCPSIEDKINRFADKDRHQLFIEPEGWNTVEMYINGFSTSLPEDVQFRALRSVAGFEKVKFFRPGYAIEYDYFPPTQLKHTLETKLVEGLYFAGQINGTTGYEEAGSQGLMAGINAALKVQEKEEFVLQRSEAYIGVLIDDLITKGTEEPYRMFTSRAEFRILLRQDNADLRLTEIGYGIGLASRSRLDKTNAKKEAVAQIEEILKAVKVKPHEVNESLGDLNTATIREKVAVHTLLKRPEIGVSELLNMDTNLADKLSSFSKEALQQAEILIKYENYIDKEEKLAEKMKNLDSFKIPTLFDFDKITALSAEAREKFKKIKPETIGQASRISGVSPADISVLLVHFGR